MNAKTAKKLRRVAKLMATGKIQSEYEKIYKRNKSVHKELTVNEKTR